MKAIKKTAHSFWTSSIQRQLMLGIMLVHAVLMTIFVYDMVERQRNFLRAQSTAQAYSLAESLAAGSVSWILANDVIGMEEVLQSQTRYPDLLYAMLLSPEGRVLGHTDREKVGLYLADRISQEMLTSGVQQHSLVNTSRLIDVSSPIFSSGEFIGWARVGLGQQKIADGLELITRNGFFYTLFAIFIGAVFAFFMAKGLTNGLHQLIQVADGVKHGETNRRSKLNRLDELGQLGEDFNLMLDTIYASKNELKQTLVKLREREQNLSITLNSIADGVIVTDNNARVLRMNPVAQRMTGWTLEQAEGEPIKSVFPIHHVKSGAVVENPIEKVLETGEVVYLSNHSTLTARNGILHQIADSAAPIHNSAGGITGVILVFRDVTKEYRIRESLKESELRYRTIFESNQAIKLIFDSHSGQILECNNSAIRFYGFDRASLTSMKIWDINCMPVDESRRLMKQVHNKEITHFATPQRLQSGEVRDVEIYPCPITTGSGDKLDYAIIFDVSKRKRAEKNLRQFELIVSSTTDLLAMLDQNYTYLTANDAYQKAFNKYADQIIGITVAELHGKEVFSKLLKPGMDRCLHGEHINFQQWLHLPMTGEKHYMDVNFTPHLGENDQTQGLIVTIRDITERKHAEEALRRSQKMDAVGQLTGGIAHDFNNILGISLGNLDMLDIPSLTDETLKKRLTTILNANERAAKLTKQLLGFSRRKAEGLDIVDINQEIERMDSLIARSLTPQVEVEQRFAENLWKTGIDSGDFQDALLNLTINARDAMAGHGRLTIETCNQILDEHYCAQNPGVMPGEYVELAISDNGAGMDEDLVERIFEPFFTTKEESKGTGLGLAMVFGFVQRSAGHIRVYSEPGIGTTVRLFLPRVISSEESAAVKAEPVTTGGRARGSETLLVVDDEQGLRELAKDSLENLGYTVFAAADAEQALAILAKEPSIKLMFSDVVMPGKYNGYDLAEKASQEYPELKILLTSGYTAKAMDKAPDCPYTANLISKPYTLNKLATALREMLGSEA